MSLITKNCKPYQKNDVKLSEVEAKNYIKYISGWQLAGDCHVLLKEYTFEDFKSAMHFAIKVAEVAEEQNHHPGIAFGYGYVGVSLQSSELGGLHENDFILAAKIDNIVDLENV